MQQTGTVGLLPQLVNPQMLMLPNNNLAKRKTKKGSCTTCGKCFGSLFIILFAIICTSCCYAYPIYNSFTNPEYFKTIEKPIWTWKMAFSKIKDIGYSMSIIKPSDEEVSQNNINNDNSTDTNRKLSIRGSNFNQTEFYKNKKITSSKYFIREYCYERKQEPWDEFCKIKNNVKNLECIDMMNGPTVCIGIRNSDYEMFLVEKNCKFVDPEIPIEIIPTISDYCSDKVQLTNGKKCPCMITSKNVERIINGTETANNKSITLNKIGLENLKHSPNINDPFENLLNNFKNLTSYFQKDFNSNNTIDENSVANLTKLNF